jgi:hypothetical protein
MGDAPGWFGDQADYCVVAAAETSAIGIGAGSIPRQASPYCVCIFGVLTVRLSAGQYVS